MSRIPKVENETDSNTESEKLSSETGNTPNDFLTASEGPSLFEIVELLLSSNELEDASEDNLKPLDKFTETSFPPIETSLPPLETSFTPISSDKNVSLLVSEGNVQIKEYSDNVAPVFVNEFNETKYKDQCTNVHIEILRPLAVKLTSVPSEDKIHQDITLDVLSESKNSNIPGQLNDNQLEQNAAQKVKAISKSSGKAFPIVQAIHEIVDFETLKIIQKNLKDKFIEKQQAGSTAVKLQQHQQLQSDFTTFQQEIFQQYALFASQPNDDAQSANQGTSDFSTDQFVPRDIISYFDTIQPLETLVEEESISDIALNPDNAAFNTFEEYLKNETNAVDIETLLKDQIIDKTTFQKIISNYSKNKTVLYDAICNVNNLHINNTAEDKIISCRSSLLSDEATTAIKYELQAHSINKRSEGEVIEVDSRSKSQQKDDLVDEELSTHCECNQKERVQRSNDEEIIQSKRTRRALSDQKFKFPQEKCIENSSTSNESARHSIQEQYLADDGCSLENFANVNNKDDRTISSHKPSTASEGFGPSCDISLVNNIGSSFSYDFESAKLKTVHLTAEQVHVTALDVNFKTIQKLDFESHKGIPKDEKIEKFEKAESILQDAAKFDHAMEDTHTEDNINGPDDSSDEPDDNITGPDDSVIEATVKEDIVKRDIVILDTVKEGPVKGATVKEDTVKEATVKEATVKEATVKEASVKEAPVKGATVKEDTVKVDIVKRDIVILDTVKEGPVKGATVKEASVKEAPVKGASVKEDTVKEATVKEATVKEDTVKEDTVKEDTVKEDTVKEDTVKEDTVKEDTVKKAPVKGAPVKEDTVKVDIVKKSEVTNDPVKEDSIVLVDSNAEKPIEFVYSLKADADNFKANLNIKQLSGINIEQSIFFNDTTLEKSKEKALSIGTIHKEESKNTLEVSLIYKKIKSFHQKMNETTENDIQKDSPQQKSSIESNNLNNDIKVKETDTSEALLATSVAEMKKLFEQKTIMMSPPVNPIGQDNTSRQSQIYPIAHEVNQSTDTPTLPNKDDQERRSSLKKDLLAQIVKKPISEKPLVDHSAKPLVDLNETTDKGQLNEIKQDDVKVKVEEPNVSHGAEVILPKYSLLCGKTIRNRHCSEQNYSKTSEDVDSTICPDKSHPRKDVDSTICPDKSHPRTGESASNKRCTETQTAVLGCSCCCSNKQQETLQDNCCIPNSHHRHSSVQHSEHGHRSGSCQHNYSMNPDQACSCLCKAKNHPHRETYHSRCERNSSFCGQENEKSWQNQTERKKYVQREEKGGCCVPHCCQRQSSAKCVHEESHHCGRDTSDDTYTENDRSGQTPKECFKTRIDANYTAIRICFKPNGKMKLCPEDCSCRDACTPDTSMSLASEICVEASYAQSDSSSSDGGKHKKIKFSSQCDITADEDSDEERIGESRV